MTFEKAVRMPCCELPRGVESEICHARAFVEWVILKIMGTPRHGDAGEVSALREELARVTEGRDRAARANRAKTELIANVSHEIRTPLNTVLGMTELLSETPLDPKQRQYVAAVQRAGAHLLALANDVLDFARLDAGRPLEIADAPFDLKRVADEAMELVARAARRKGLEMRVDVARDVPATAHGDARRIRQVLVNLLGNAVKFTQKGHVWLVVANDGTGVVRFSVHDTGIGVAPEQRDLIFASFVQGGDANERREGGAGLGLHIAKRLVDAMGGRIWVESELGKGSAFHVSLRLPAAAARRTAPATSRPPMAIPARVLLVDDSEESRALVEEFLRPSGAFVEYAANGTAALEKMESETFDVVLMDLHLPGMDGFATTRAIRKVERDHHRPPVPVIALSADALAETVRRSLAVGCSVHLSKPITKAALLEAIELYAKPRSRGGAHAQLDVLMPAFLANRARDVVRVREAVARGDFDAIATIGHNMRGNGASYGLARISAIGRKLEAAAHAASVARIRASADELDVYLTTGGAEEVRAPEASSPRPVRAPEASSPRPVRAPEASSPRPVRTRSGTRARVDATRHRKQRAAR
jgi:signal transduction histidine kinase/DNA-binding response OmpR family regulator